MARRGGDGAIERGAILRDGRGGLCRDRCGRGRRERRVGGPGGKQRDEACRHQRFREPARPVGRQDGDDRQRHGRDLGKQRGQLRCAAAMGIERQVEQDHQRQDHHFRIADHQRREQQDRAGRHRDQDDDDQALGEAGRPRRLDQDVRGQQGRHERRIPVERFDHREAGRDTEGEPQRRARCTVCATAGGCPTGHRPVRRRSAS